MEQKEQARMTEEEALRFYREAYMREQKKNRFLSGRLADEEYKNRELEKKLAAEIIDGYDGVTVSAAQEDPTVCLVEFGFSVDVSVASVQAAAEPCALGTPHEGAGEPVRGSERDPAQVKCQGNRTEGADTAWNGQFSERGGGRTTAADEI